MDKLCIRCGETKDTSEYHKHSQKKDGLNSYCKTCVSKQSKQYYEQNTDSIKEKVAIYRNGENREKILERKREESKARYRNEEWKNKYSDKRAKECKRWRDNHPEHVKNYNKKYKTEKAEFCEEIRNRRVSSKRTCTPTWLTNDHKKEIDKIYKKMRELNKESGDREYHVDHSIPLQGNNVSGLHVPWNLQILTASENTSKKDKFDGTPENNSWRENV